MAGAGAGGSLGMEGMRCKEKKSRETGLLSLQKANNQKLEECESETEY